MFYHTYHHTVSPPFWFVCLPFHSISELIHLSLLNLTRAVASWLLHSTPEREVRVQALTGEQGCRSGESSCPPPLWFGFDSRTRRHVWVEFVVGSHPCSEGFPPGSLVFLPPQKSTHLNSNSISKQWMKSHLMEMPLQIPLLLLLLLLLLLFVVCFSKTFYSHHASLHPYT